MSNINDMYDDDVAKAWALFPDSTTIQKLGWVYTYFFDNQHPTGGYVVFYDLPRWRETDEEMSYQCSAREFISSVMKRFLDTDSVYFDAKCPRLTLREVKYLNTLCADHLEEIHEMMMVDIC